MRPHPLRSRSFRSLLPVLALSLAVPLSACGGDDSAEQETDPSPAADADAGDLDELTEDADDAFGGDLDTIAGAIDSVLDSVTGYTIDGTEIVLQSSEDPDSTSLCTIAGTVLGSFTIPEGTVLTVEHPGGTSECDL